MAEMQNAIDDDGDDDDDSDDEDCLIMMVCNFTFTQGKKPFLKTLQLESGSSVSYLQFISLLLPFFNCFIGA